MGEIKISNRKIPIPEPQYSKYPFATMKVGDNFIANDDGKVIAAACMYGKKHGMKFRTRKVTEGGKTSRRVWRIE